MEKGVVQGGENKPSATFGNFCSPFILSQQHSNPSPLFYEKDETSESPFISERSLVIVSEETVQLTKAAPKWHHFLLIEKDEEILQLSNLKLEFQGEEVLYVDKNNSKENTVSPNNHNNNSQWSSPISPRKIQINEPNLSSPLSISPDSSSKYGAVPPPRRTPSRLSVNSNLENNLHNNYRKSLPASSIHNLIRMEEEKAKINYNGDMGVVFQSGNAQLDSVLNNPWKLQIFQHYLQNLQQETVFQFYIDLQKCKESWKKEVQLNNDPLFKARKIGEQAVKIFQMYLSHDTLPPQLKDLLRESAVPFIVTDYSSVGTPRSRSDSTNSINTNTNSVDDLDSMSGDHSLIYSDELISEDCNEFLDDDDLINNVAEELVNLNSNLNDFDDNFDFRERKRSVTVKIIDGSIFNAVETKCVSMLISHLDAFNSEYQNVANYRPSVCVQLDDQSNDKMGEKDIYFLDTKSKSPHHLQTPSLTSKNVIIEYATLDALFKRLTTPNALTLYGMDFQTSFILCYRYFSSTEEFISLMKLKIDVILLSNPHINNSEKGNVLYQNWNKINLLPTVLRISSLTKLLVESHLEFFRKETLQKSIIIDFVQNEIHKVAPMPAKNLIDYINKKIAIREKISYSGFQFDKKPPKPKIKKIKGKGEFSISAMYMTELARQMTILDFRLFRSIRVEECLSMNWTRDNKDKISPNVLASIRQFCNVSLWVAEQVVVKKEIEKRVEVLRRMIKLAQANFDLANFNGAMAVYCGLRNHSVIRLKQTWELLPAASWDMWEKLESAFKCDMNFLALRNIQQSAPLPSIPYLGLFLSDLTFIDNEPNFHPEKSNLVNFSKMQFIGAIMNQIKKFQTTAYNFEEIESFQQFLNNLHPLNENELYKLSIARESLKGKIVCRSKKKRSSSLMKKSKRK